MCPLQIKTHYGDRAYLHSLTRLDISSVTWMLLPWKSIQKTPSNVVFTFNIPAFLNTSSLSLNSSKQTKTGLKRVDLIICIYLIPLDLGGFIQLFLFCTLLLSTLIDLILVVCDLFFFCDVIKGARCLRCPALVLLLSANTVLQLSGSQGCIINKNALQCSAFYFNCTFSSGTQ